MRAASPKQEHLQRNLTIWEAIALSIAIMAPSMAANINPQASAGVVGRAVPLSFLIATFGALLIAHSFVRLSQRYHHAGSVYGFVGATVGARSGVFSGWLLACVYAFYAIFTAAAAGKFLAGEAASIGLISGDAILPGYIFAALSLAIVWYFATRTARRSTQIMLIVEAATVALILLVVGIVLVKILSGNAPEHQTFDLSVFVPSPDADASSIFLGVVFGFLSFAGFEGAATLGEETKNPKLDVPRAIWGTVLFGGAFYVVVTAVEVMGFGTSADQIQSFVNASSLIAELSTKYAAPWLGHVITLGAAVSAISCALATSVGASRLIYAMARDGAGPQFLNQISEGHRIPSRAVGLVIVVSWIYFAVTAICQLDVFSAASIAGTAGTLLLLIAYFMACLGCLRLLVKGTIQVRKWELLVPVAAMVVLAYTMFRNIWPLPEGSALWGPALFVLVALVVAFGILQRPDAMRRAGENLMRDEGLPTTDDDLSGGLRSSEI